MSWRGRAMLRGFLLGLAVGIIVTLAGVAGLLASRPGYVYVAEDGVGTHCTLEMPCQLAIARAQAPRATRVVLGPLLPNRLGETELCPCDRTGLPLRQLVAIQRPSWGGIPLY